ncbi:MAG: hypothetical protein EOO43_18675 [Flavobacterium sp.]|nr:MAG: hypothetical protein EOO43_18675 [Flavobacterium sp.]
MKLDSRTNTDIKPNLKLDFESDIEIKYNHNIDDDQVPNIPKSSNSNNTELKHQEPNNYDIVYQPKTDINDKKIDLYNMIEDKNVEITLNPIDYNITKPDDLSNKIEIYNINGYIDNTSIETSLTGNESNNDKKSVDHNNDNYNPDEYNDNEEPKEYIFESNSEKLKTTRNLTVAKELFKDLGADFEKINKLISKDMGDEYKTEVTPTPTPTGIHIDF